MVVEKEEFCYYTDLNIKKKGFHWNMRRIFRLSCWVRIGYISSIISICPILALASPSVTVQPTPTIRAQNVNLAQLFQDFDVTGSIIIYDLKNNQAWEHNPQRNRTAFPAASTFKILNSLIALETGVIPNEIAVLTWDGRQRELPAWNRDLNMKEAFKVSAVWFYQVLARRVGYERMQEWVKKAEYGNQNIGQETDIDQFWLNGKLRISPEQQITFIRRLYENTLPFSQKSLKTVKDIMISETKPEYTIRSKTGWYGFGNSLVPNIGWYVGYVETKGNVYFFATNIDIHTENDATARNELTRRCFQQLGIL